MLHEFLHCPKAPPRRSDPKANNRHGRTERTLKKESSWMRAGWKTNAGPNGRKSFGSSRSIRVFFLRSPSLGRKTHATSHRQRKMAGATPRLLAELLVCVQVEALTHQNRATTVHAVRDSELAKLPEGALRSIKRKFPQVSALAHPPRTYIKVSGSCGTCSCVSDSLVSGGHQADPLTGTEDPAAGQRSSDRWGSWISAPFTVSCSQGRPLILRVCPPARSLALHTHGSKWDAGNQASNLSTVTVLPVSEDVPLTAFTLELQHALVAIGDQHQDDTGAECHVTATK